MLKEMGFYRGVDLGGWLSQCDYSRQRLDHFIEEKDLEKIAAWGLDHVRIPVDYNILENEDGSYRDDGFERINRALAWCRKYGLNAAGIIKLIHESVACGCQMTQIGRTVADVIDHVQIKRNARFMCDCRNMKHGVTGTAERHVCSERVAE